MLLFCALALPAQFKPSKICKFLTPEDAAAVMGAGAALTMAIENGGCTYTRGGMTLLVAQPARVSDRRALEMGYEGMSKGGKPVEGVGERAHLKKEGSGYQLVFLKKGTLMSLQVYGEGSEDPAMANKLVEAGKKAAGRL